MQTLDEDDSSSVASDTGELPGDGYQTIAVLPFVTMSEDTGNEYFSDGLTEELLNILTKIKKLRVAGRTSSFAFKGKDDDLRIIGEKLNVGSILEGSVRKDDKRNLVRITVQLINVDDGFHLWSETYDRELDDIFAIQDEIAHAVAKALRITLLGEDEVRLEQVVSTEINAYDLYLQALQGLNEGGYMSLENANVHLNMGDIAKGAKGFFDAIERDPGDYEMLAAMCHFWILLGDVEQAQLWQQRADAIGANQPIPIWSRLKLYKFREQHDLARDLAWQTLERKIEDRYGTNSLFRQNWAFQSARIGNYQAALNPYREAFPWAFPTPLEVPDDLQDQIWDIIQIAGLLKLAEPMSGRPEQLLDIVTGSVDQQYAGWGVWNPDLTRAAIATIRGEREVAMNWLNSAWEKKMARRVAGTTIGRCDLHPTG